jgi:hypothetical protein
VLPQRESEPIELRLVPGRAPCCSLLLPHPTKPAVPARKLPATPLFLISFSCCLAHQAGSNNPLRIPPSRRQAKSRTFFFPSSTDSEPPADSAQSSHHRSRSRILLVPPGDSVQASAPRLAIFSPFSSPFDSALARTDLCFLTCFGGFLGTLRTNWLLFPFSSAWNRAQGTRVSPCVQS